MTSTELTDRHLEQFRRDGFVALHLFGEDEVAEIRDTFMEMARNGPVDGLSEVRRRQVDGEVRGYDASDPLSFYPRMMQPHRHPDKPVGPVAMKYLVHPRLKPVLTALFDEEPYAAQSMFYFKPPGARGQALHQDNFYLRVKPGTCMAAWIAVDDADQANGGMMCVPNTGGIAIACPEAADPKLYFSRDHVEPPAGLAPQPINLRAGDVLFFNGNVIHGSTPNGSRDRFRRALICHYVPASTMEMSNYYEAHDFAGRRRDIDTNDDGGPCGTPHGLPASPH
jgi:hypothetical protein